MRYMLSIYENESAFQEAAPEQIKALMDGYNKFTEDIVAAGVMLAGDGLQPSPTSTTVRVRDGERLLTDGPFAETKEQLGGFYLIDVGSLDEALDWAARIPGAQYGAVEVRPVMDYEATRAQLDEALGTAS